MIETKHYYIITADNGFKFRLPKKPTESQQAIIQMFYEASKLELANKP